MPNSSNNAFVERNRLPCFLSAACIALTVVVFGTRTSKGSAFSAATRTNIIRTASETDMPILASVADASSFTFSSTRTWTIVVEGITGLLRYIVSQACRMLRQPDRLRLEPNGKARGDRVCDLVA